MNPRLKTSGKRQKFPIDYIKMIREVIAKNFKKSTLDKTVIVEGYIYSEEILIQIGFQNKGEITQRNFQASIDYSVKRKNIMERIYAAIDALGSMIDQYFQADGKLELPTMWQEFRMDGNSVFLMTSTENSNLEELADQFLKKNT